MNIYYLYLLVFKNGKHFKIGISSNDFSKVNLLHSIYEIDFKASKIVIAPIGRSIKILEKKLLNIWDESVSDYNSLDGSNKIRSIEWFKDVLGEIEKQKWYLNFRIKPLTCFLNDDDSLKKEILKKRKQIIDSLVKILRIKLYQLFYHRETNSYRYFEDTDDGCVFCVCIDIKNDFSFSDQSAYLVTYYNLNESGNNDCETKIYLIIPTEGVEDYNYYKLNGIEYLKSGEVFKMIQPQLNLLKQKAYS